MVHVLYNGGGGSSLKHSFLTQGKAGFFILDRQSQPIVPIHPDCKPIKGYNLYLEIEISND